MTGETPSKTEDGFVAHTPTPWKVYRTPSGAIRGIGEANGDGILDHHGGFWRMGAEAEANAAFIVRAVNAHDDLIETLHEVAEFLDNQSDVEDGDYGVPRPNRAMQLLIEVRNAISKAEGISHV